MFIKKGQGNVIAWVLLVGFAISLAVLVGRWSIQQAQSSTEGIVDMSEADIRCESVAISAVCTGSDGNYKLDVSNKGSLIIKSINVGGCDTPKIDGPIGLNEKTGEIGLSICGETIRLIPMIDINGKTIGCSAKEINIKIDDCA